MTFFVWCFLSAAIGFDPGSQVWEPTVTCKVADPSNSNVVTSGPLYIPAQEIRNAEKANRDIRKQTAAMVLATLSINVSPDDLYFPLSHTN